MAKKKKEIKHRHPLAHVAHGKKSVGSFLHKLRSGHVGRKIGEGVSKAAEALSEGSEATAKETARLGKKAGNAALSGISRGRSMIEKGKEKVKKERSSNSWFKR